MHRLFFRSTLTFIFLSLLIFVLTLNTAALSLSRRDVLILTTTSHTILNNPSPPAITYEKWTGTNLPHLSLHAVLSSLEKKSNPLSTFPMARWPDPVLRVPATPIPPTYLSSPHLLHNLAATLRRTCRHHNAVGLAAQQCGIDASVVVIEQQPWSSPEGRHVVLFNPRIVDRSPEIELRPWIERCLVLPPSFRAVVLRDDEVVVEAEDLEGRTREWTLTGATARAVQHEMDHDGGILILDHVGLEEMADDAMREMEREGHEERQRRAFARDVVERRREWEGVVSMASATEGEMTCDDECLGRIKERRELNRQSRTTRNRRDILELSRQRALLYNTTYRGV